MELSGLPQRVLTQQKPPLASPSPLTIEAKQARAINEDSESKLVSFVDDTMLGIRDQNNE